MGRPCIGERPMTMAERMRRYRARKRGSDVRPITYRPLPAVTKPVRWAFTRPPWRFEFGSSDRLARRPRALRFGACFLRRLLEISVVEPLATVETAVEAGQRWPMAGLGSNQAPDNAGQDAQSGSWAPVRGASGKVIEIASLIGLRGASGRVRSPTDGLRVKTQIGGVAAWRK